MNNNNNQWLEFVQASAPNSRSLWQLEKAVKKVSWSRKDPANRKWRSRRFDQSDKANEARPTQQVLAIIKLAIDLLVVAHPRIMSVGLSYVRWGSSPTGDDIEIEYTPSSKSFLVASTLGAKDRVFRSRSELAAHLERLAERFVFTYVSVSGIGRFSKRESATIYLYSIPDQGGIQQKFEVARRNSAARKIQAAYLKAHYDPKHPIGHRRLLREFEQLSATLPTMKPNTPRQNARANKPKTRGLGRLFRRKAVR